MALTGTAADGSKWFPGLVWRLSGTDTQVLRDQGTTDIRERGKSANGLNRSRGRGASI